MAQIFLCHASENQPATWKNTIGMEFVLIPAGEFMMGSTDRGAHENEQPVHKVTITQPFYLGKYEVTQGEWQAVTGENPSEFKGDPTRPVEQVSWDDVQEFMQKLNAQEGGTKYRLPTEAEWEYAARGGHDSRKFVWGDEDFCDEEPLANTWQGEFPWQNLLTDGHERTAPVGTFPANDYGLSDMTGNVWEWTCDWYVPCHANEVIESCCGVAVNPRIDAVDKSYDPAQPQFQIPRKVVKGGSFLCAPSYCLRYRPAARQPQMVDTGMSHIGFRCMISD